MAYYVVEKSRDGSRRIYHSGRLIPYEKRKPALHGYKTAGAAAGICSKLSLKVAFAIYDRRALEGEKFYEETYKDYYVEDGRLQKEEARLMSVREFLNTCQINWDSVTITEDYDGDERQPPIGKYKDMRKIPDYALQLYVSAWDMQETTEADGSPVVEIIIGV